MPVSAKSRLLRCAIYTRKSTDAGLEQDFNSLDAQRDAAEAYIRSQAHEGWRLIATAYDDGGYSGGSMDRPGLQALLGDVGAGLIDIIVVYKVDRLTRSLADFAKLVDLFDDRGVSFVSVTQSFNTTSSMGRLTLNVLLSFAQFEREVTGERIRDKIAASKKKGIWMGGPVPLGYRVENRKLVVVQDEAERVREIFKLALQSSSLSTLINTLRDRGILTKVTVRKDGSQRGGIAFTKGPLAYLLANRVYLGELVHKRVWHRGEHAAIIEPDIFDAVQLKLKKQRTAFWSARAGSAALLLGHIFDERGVRMSPTSSRKRGVRYRYYVARDVIEGRAVEGGRVTRISAPDIEAAVVAAIRDRLSGSDQAEPEGGATSNDRALVQLHLERVEVGRNEIRITMRDDKGNSALLSIPGLQSRGRVRREILMAEQGGDAQALPMRADTRLTLLVAIAKARAWTDALISGRMRDVDGIATAEGRTPRYVRMVLPLAFVAPDVVRAILEHKLPESFGVSRFMSGLPLTWEEQRAWTGLSQD